MILSWVILMCHARLVIFSLYLSLSKSFTAYLWTFSCRLDGKQLVCTLVNIFCSSFHFLSLWPTLQRSSNPSVVSSYYTLINHYILFLYWSLDWAAIEIKHKAFCLIGFFDYVWNSCFLYKNIERVKNKYSNCL